MAVKIQFACACGKSLAADVKLAGRKGKCPACGRAVQVPTFEQQDDSELSLTPADDPVEPTNIGHVGGSLRDPHSRLGETRPRAGNKSAAASLPRAITPEKRPSAEPPPLPGKSICDEEVEYRLAVPEARCQHCRAPMKEGAKFCSECGGQQTSGEPGAGVLAKPRQKPDQRRWAPLPLWLRASIVAGGLGLLFLGSQASYGITLAGGLIGAFTILAGMAILVVSFFWYWGLSVQHDSGAAIRILITVVAAPFGIGVYWRGGMGGGTPAYDGVKRLAKRGLLVALIGGLMFAVTLPSFLQKHGRGPGGAQPANFPAGFRGR